MLDVVHDFLVKYAIKGGVSAEVSHRAFALASSVFQRLAYSSNSKPFASAPSRNLSFQNTLELAWYQPKCRNKRGSCYVAMMTTVKQFLDPNDINSPDGSIAIHLTDLNGIETFRIYKRIAKL